MLWGTQEPVLLASEKSGHFSSGEGHVGIPLGSLLMNRAVSRGQSAFQETLFLCASDRNLGLPLKVQLGSQASSGVEHGTVLSYRVSLFWFLSLEFSKRHQASCHVQAGNRGFFKRFSGASGLPSCCEGILGVPLEPAQGNWDLSQADGKQDVLFHCSRIRGVPLEIQLMRQASSFGVRGSWDSS